MRSLPTFFHSPLKKIGKISARFLLLRAIYRVWLNYRGQLANCEQGVLARGKIELDRACQVWHTDDRDDCRKARRSLYAWDQKLPRRPFGRILRDLLSALLIATLGAIVIRTCWFELYHVPTGSMRPTILEQDRLIVTKTAFGLNRPLSPKPLLFNSNLLERGQIVTFTSHGLDVEGKTRHFGLFPGYRRFVKRLWAKGGDCVYFYGGEIYILDARGNLVRLPGDDQRLADLEIIPLISFQGKIKETYQSGQRCLVHQHFGIAMRADQRGALPWGLDNYAMGRLIERPLVPDEKRANFPTAGLWLQLLHHARHAPWSKQSDPLPHWTLHESYLPLSDEHIERLRHALSTSRFSVKSEMARRYESPNSKGIDLAGVPDGNYEFCKGSARFIGFGGQATSLAKSHPIYAKELLPKLFNAGFDFAPEQNSARVDKGVLPLRYIYYRDGDLRCMASILMKAEDPHLVALKENESALQRQNPGYLPFLDEKAPWVGSEKRDLESMLDRGLKVPAGHTLVLGDNSPRSSDSRDFGFVPETNIQGSPLAIFWPLSSAQKHLQRPPLESLTLYRFIVWATAAFAITGHIFLQRGRMRKIVDQRPWRL